MQHFILFISGFLVFGSFCVEGGDVICSKGIQQTIGGLWEYLQCDPEGDQTLVCKALENLLCGESCVISTEMRNS